MSTLFKGFLIGGIRAYQRYISKILGPRCRFYPSCSEYSVICLEKYPITTALLKLVARVFRCHPWHPGGVDFP